MKPWKTRQRRLLMITVVVVGSALVYGKAIDPRIQRGAALHTQLDLTREELAEIRSLIAHREEISAHSRELQKQVAPEGNDEAEMKSLLEEIEGLTQRSRMKVLSLRPQRMRDMGYYHLLSVELVSEGSQRDVARFLYNLGGSQQLLRVDRMQVSALREVGRLRVEFLVAKILSSGG